MVHAKVEDVVAHARSRFEATLERLANYLTFPAISCDPTHAGDVAALARQISADLERLGFQRARVLSLPDALPAVAAERLAAGPDKPTVLVYGHLDLQPVKGEAWATPPHQATRSGGRLYARGSADDMGGWVSHLAAVEAWLAVVGELPCNVKFFIEGEEEIGSPNLERYMDAFPDAFDADVMVLTDCENPSRQIPGLTVSLRGLLELDVTCEALHSDVHSGLWGNVVPDSAVALIKLLARLVDDDGRMRLLRTEVPAAWRERAWQVPLTDEVVRAGGRLIDEVAPLPDRGVPRAEWLWRQPAVTILSTTLPVPEQRKNAVRRRASATISIRLAPGQTAEQMQAAVAEVLLADPPGGVKVTVERRPGGGQSWLYEPHGPAFEAVDRAYERAWGCTPLRVGVGGTIPFVAQFGQRFSDLPLILNGVLDPESSPHGPNESLDLEILRKAIDANIYLLDELAAVPGLARARG